MDRPGLAVTLQDAPKFAMPASCSCCMATPQGTVPVYVTSTSIHEFPVCTKCATHIRRDDRVEGIILGSTLLLVLLLAALFRAAGWNTFIGGALLFAVGVAVSCALDRLLPPRMLDRTLYCAWPRLGVDTEHQGDGRIRCKFRNLDFGRKFAELNKVPPDTAPAYAPMAPGPRYLGIGALSVLGLGLGMVGITMLLCDPPTRLKANAIVHLAIHTIGWAPTMFILAPIVLVLSKAALRNAWEIYRPGSE